MGGGGKIRPGERKSERTPPTGGKNPPRPLTSAHPLATIAIHGLNGGRVGVEVGGEGVGRSDGVGLGGRGSEVGSRKGRSVGRSVGVGRGVGRGVGPYVPTK